MQKIKKCVAEILELSDYEDYRCKKGHFNVLFYIA